MPKHNQPKKACKADKCCKKECCFCLCVPVLPQYHTYNVEIPTNPKLCCRCCKPKQKPLFPNGF